MTTTYSKVAWFLIVTTIYTIIQTSSCANKCLINRQEVNPKRYIQYEGMNLNISLETSSRASHILTTHVFKIFLQEVLGYVRVEIIHQDDEFNVENIFERISGPLDEQTSTVPTSMVNLEIWVPPEINTMSLLDVYHVKECGSVAPPGRFGWFIPAQLSYSIKGLEKWWTEEMQDVQWTLFRDSVASEVFSIHNKFDMRYIEKHSFKDYASEINYCNAHICQNGMYTPERCKKTNCALLLAPYYNVTKFVIQHIDEMKLYVNVIWLGPNLKHVTDKLTQKYIKQNVNQSLVILGWTPSAFISPEYNFIRVAFKRCELLSSSHKVGCKYEMNRLIKASWSKMEQIAKPAYEALHRITFSQRNYNDLLQQFNLMSSNQSIYDVACDWMKNNDKTWQHWIPGTDRGKVNIYIGGIFPITGSSYTAKGIVLAARMAKEAINKNNTILENYNINLLAHDGQCKADMVMKRFIDYIVHKYYENLVGVLGPACSDTVEPLAGVSKHYKTLVISYSAEGASFSDRKKYPYFFRTIGENKQYILVYQYLLKQMGWNKIAALSEDGQKYTEYISHMQALLEKQGISFIANIKFPRERTKYSMKRYLEDLKRRRARIIIADVYDEVARSVMCEAYKLGMTAQEGYVWFLPSWLSLYWYNTTHYNRLFNESVNCTMDMMIDAINGHFALTNAFFAPNDAMMQESKTVGQWRENYAIECEAQHLNVSDYAGYAYDAMWIFAMALDKLVRDDPESLADLHSHNTTLKLINHVQETDFEGVSGRIKFHGGSSRFSVINVVQWVNTKTTIVGTFTPNISDGESEVMNGVLTLNTSEILWLSSNGQKPDDGTEPIARCVFHNLAELLNVDCEIAVIVANIICFGLLGIIFVLSIFFWKRRYDKKVQLTQQYMKSLGLDFLNVTNMSDLDKWEIPRDHVVINRKLGEGAFGTVYGGEAHFPDKGWVAVAVKTLKVGSTTEEKVDFLSEAEVMKRFEHKNIIRLLGVCTKSEPVYTVMEFMLYGDLKTFLLARRHLINKKNMVEECEEISAKKLTMMALDVARAFSYLAELKYVHRDLACRNCLVNAQRVIKLADFGMARPTFENDYYKFNRKGMLPVRWMAPESLSLGVFTSSSDVWSYGVFLYEMITFGGFPYQGLSNYQVLEHVKTGHYIKIPRGVNPQLEGLIVSCWNKDPKKRPQASAIVEFLATNPRLLSPCIDVPVTMPVENDDQIETCFSNKPGKVSLCFTSPTDQFMNNDNVIDGSCGVSFTPLQRTNSELSEI